MDRRITNMAKARDSTDAINLDDCLDLIRGYVIDFDVLEVDENYEYRVFSVRKARMTNIAPLKEDSDVVMLGFLKSFIEEKIKETLPVVPLKETDPDRFFERIPDDVVLEEDIKDDAEPGSI